MLRQVAVVAPPKSISAETTDVCSNRVAARAAIAVWVMAKSETSAECSVEMARVAAVVQAVAVLQIHLAVAPAEDSEG